MSSSTTFINNYTNAITQLVQTLQTLETLNAMLSDNASLGTPPSSRPDITAQDVTNASSAITQMLFTFNSGSPTQASYLYKMTMP